MTHPPAITTITTITTSALIRANRQAVGCLLDQQRAAVEGFTVRGSDTDINLGLVTIPGHDCYTAIDAADPDIRTRRERDCFVNLFVDVDRLRNRRINIRCGEKQEK